MSGENQERDVEINLSSGASEYKYSKRTVYFTAPEMKPVAKAVDYLSGRNYVLKNQLFIGQITKLMKEPENTSGKVTINVIFKGKSKKFSFILTGDNYYKALKAHEIDSYVECSGDVHFTKTSAEIFNVISFNVIQQHKLE